MLLAKRSAANIVIACLSHRLDVHRSRKGGLLLTCFFWSVSWEIRQLIQSQKAKARSGDSFFDECKRSTVALTFCFGPAAME